MTTRAAIDSLSLRKRLQASRRGERPCDIDPPCLLIGFGVDEVVVAVRLQVRCGQSHLVSLSQPEPVGPEPHRLSQLYVTEGSPQVARR